MVRNEISNITAASATSRLSNRPSLTFCFVKTLQSQEVEETLKRIQQHKGVVGTIVVNNEGECLT